MTAQDPLRVALERAIGFQYDVIRLLGRGGMGAVYHAHERALDRPVAIKVLPPDVASHGSDARERFLREARTAARLTHPNIVPLFTFGETEGLVYFVMGYVEGESLEQRLRRSGPLDADTAMRILEQLASALDYAHQQGIVHRDVKPDNILLDAAGTAKLTDFGIAKRATGGETLTGTGLLMGTPRYMSPEQASGDRELDARSDIYALGLVAFAMLTGRPPFDGGSVQEILAQQVTREPPSLRKLLPDLPSAAVTAVERALQKDPSRRWPNAGAMAAVLRDDDGDTDLSATTLKPRAGSYAITTALSLVAIVDLAALALLRLSEDAFFLWALPIAPLGIVWDYISMRWRQKLPADEVRRIFTQPPQWWPFWWPRAWRRRDDVWQRLPRELKRNRVLATIGIGALVAAMHGMLFGLMMPNRWEIKGPLIGVSALVLLPLSLVGLLGSLMSTRRFARRHGVPLEEAYRVAGAPTGRARLWRNPMLARFLQPAGAPDARIEPSTPRALADAVIALGRALPVPQQEALGNLDDAARTLLVAIDALDAEIALVTRNADPAEVSRLESRIAALGPASVSDSPAQREMRGMYVSQLEMLRRLSRQARELSDRRARYAELLRTLWLQLVALRADNAADTLAAQDVSGRIRHIVRSVESEVKAREEVAEAIRR